MASLQEILAAKKKKTQEAQASNEKEKVIEAESKEVEEKTKPSKLDDVLTAKQEAKPFAKEITKGLALPPEPEIGSTPDVYLRWQLDKLNAIVEQNGAVKETLKEVHANLKDNPDLEEILLPQDLGSITRAMKSITQSTHVRKQKEKTTRISKKVEKEEKTNKVTDALKGLF